MSSSMQIGLNFDSNFWDAFPIELKDGNGKRFGSMKRQEVGLGLASSKMCLCCNFVS